jgi:hypothetical protein
MAIRDFALSEYPGVWEKVLEHATPVTREVVGELLPNGWYPCESYVELVELVAKLAPGDDLAVAEASGRWEVRRDFEGGIYRALLALTTPTMAIRASGALWGMYQGSGEFKATSLGRSSARITITNFAGASALYWANVRGFAAQLAQMANAPNARCELSEGGKDGEHFMVAEVSWDVA